MGLSDFFNQSQAERTINADPNNPEHQGHLSHELIGGAAAFAAARAYEQKQEREGKPANHALAKELLAAFAGAEVDKLAETKGLSFLDREKAKHEAKKQAEAALAQSGQY
ncbi:uncharacterized protein EHS24_004476 [Apiotrichum porosum]|uniref:CipC-like antibiotic response protein n=1 Tax=Apiotrichum porosum TaxID=105984 RepID=A0A427Y575_9TREE|nr:uncharacterized protein EHS24_004476 [Apiotrichum porosum]RSH86238.1 hypothetical protein EHS24_004476 [Apiotrichum porosum]